MFLSCFVIVALFDGSCKLNVLCLHKVLCICGNVLGNVFLIQEILCWASLEQNIDSLTTSNMLNECSG